MRVKINHKRYDVTNAPKAVKQLFMLLEEHKLPLRVVPLIAGYAKNLMYSWVSKKSSAQAQNEPCISALEDCFNVIGYTLVPVPFNTAAVLQQPDVKDNVALPVHMSHAQTIGLIEKSFDKKFADYLVSAYVRAYELDRTGE